MMEIRDATAGDMGDVLAIYNDAVLNTTAVYDYAPRSLAVQQEWFATKAAQGWPVLVAAEGERVVGFCSYGPFRAWPAYHRTVECSIYVAPDRRGRGIGKRLLPALLERAQASTFHAIVAGIDATNDASLRLHARLGFEKVAHFREVGWKFERWLDVVIMQRALGPGDARPAA